MEEVFARFKKELKSSNGNYVFKVDDGTKNTRYLVLTENESEVYIAIYPNNFKTNSAGRFYKDTMDEVLTLVEEYV